MTETRFVHLSDSHITDPSIPDSHLHSDTAATFQQVQAMIARLEPRPDFIVISGDLTNAGNTANFTALREHLARFDLPVVLALGNHDTRQGFYETVLGEPERGDAPYHHAQVINGLHVITLDSSTPGSVLGTLEPEQLAWLRTELEAYPDVAKLLVVHHPPADMHLPIFDHINWVAADRDAFGAILREAVAGGRKIVGVLSGHVHYDQYATWNGVPCIISAGLHNLTDALETDGLRSVSGGSFNVGRVRDGELTMYTVPLPSDGKELYRLSLEQLRAYMSAHAEAAAPAEQPLEPQPA
jgi:3',5'-cyclic AMP phosphodiesterase CpdA